MVRFGYRSWAASAVVGCCVAGGLWGAGRAPVAAAEPAGGAIRLLADSSDEEFFDKKIQPILSEACAKCHLNGKHKGGFKMDTREDVLKGGEDGKQVEPGQPDKSPLIKAIRWEGDDKDKWMPPEDKHPKLTDAQIADMTKWVEKGLPWGTKK